MGSILYDYLAESPFFDPRRIDDGFLSMSDADLRLELRRYRSFHQDNVHALTAEVTRLGEGLIFSGRQTPTLDELKRTALYARGHIVDDPLFGRTYEMDPDRLLLGRSSGFGEPILDRQGILKAVRYLRDATPMVDHNYLKFLPLSRLHEPPKEIAITYSENLFRELLPPQVLEFLRSRAAVHSLRPVEGQPSSWYIEDSSKPSRAISIDFPSDRRHCGYMFTLHETRIRNFDSSTNIAEMEHYLPDTPPDSKSFALWVDQSTNRAASWYFDQVLSEAALSERLNASYFTRSELAFDLLRCLGAQTGGVPEQSVATLLSVDLPVLENVGIDTIMRVRSDDGEAFQAFRAAWEKGVLELRTESDPLMLETKKQNLVHLLTDIQLREISPKLGSLLRTALAEAALGAIGLCGTFHDPKWSLLPLAIAALTGYATYENYRRETKLNPAYFLWKLKKGAEPARAPDTRSVPALADPRGEPRR